MLEKIVLSNVKLKKILKEKSDKSTYENQYPMLSSTNSGIELRNGRTNSSSNIGYKILSKNELVLSSQNLWLGDSAEYLEAMTKKYKRYGIENGFAYLTHRTQGAEKKHQYSFKEVKSNFNYGKYIEKLQHRVEMANKLSDKEFIEKMLDGYLNNKVSEIEAKRRVLYHNPLLMQNFLRKLDAVKNTKLEIDADEWFRNRSKNNDLKSVVWISVCVGTGKTVLAKVIAQNVVKDNII